MIMSSFFMNQPSHYLEPKFPPTEEYSQNSYMHNAGLAPEDYCHEPPPPPPHGYHGYAPDHRRYAQDTSAYMAHNGAVQGGPYGACVSSAPAANLPPPPPPTAQEAPSPPHVNSGYAVTSENSPTLPSPTQQASSDSEQKPGQVIYPWMKKVHMGSSGNDTTLVCCSTAMFSNRLNLLARH